MFDRRYRLLLRLVRHAESKPVAGPVRGGNQRLRHRDRHSSISWLFKFLPPGARSHVGGHFLSWVGAVFQANGSKAQNDRLNARALEIGVEPPREFGPVVMRNHRIEVMFQVIEMLERDDRSDLAAKQAGLR